ncbi:MAG: hypothetical protein JRI68_34240, partial [Deltaproteobacteria bacterium]|nr:hypothetical protein [Deltaproteobacteria bacterium]
MLRPSMLFGVAVLTAGACGPTPTVEAPVAPAASISTDDSAAGSTASRMGWRYHPRQMADITDGVVLSDGSWLLAGELGERWRTEPLPSSKTARDGSASDGSDTRTYFATTTVHRAPERIDRIVRWSTRRWLFVGESGTLYSSPGALGPLTSSTAPPVKLHRIAGSARGLVGVDALGQLYRYDGSTWSAPQGLDPSCTGLTPCRRLFDVAATETGKLLGLAIPEQVLSSDDGGKTWTEQGGDPFGAGRLLRSVAGGVLIEGANQTLHWPGSGAPQAVNEDLRLPLPTDGRLTLLPRRGPSTVAIDERRAVLTGDHYYEVFADPAGRYLASSPDETGGPKGNPTHSRRAAARQNPWLLASGAINAPLSVRRLDLIPSSGSAKKSSPARSTGQQGANCQAVRIAARDAVLLVACMRESGESVIVDLHRSTQGGKGFSKVATVVAPDDDLSLAVAADGSALIAGACLAKPPAKGKPDLPSGTCEPQGPIRLPTGRGAKPVHCAAGDLTDRATSVTYSVDGQEAYFFGRRAKDERIALFVSRDAGQTFFSRPLVAPKGAPRRWDVEREGTRTIHPMADGIIGMVLGSHPPAYVVADREGRISGVARLPDGATSVSGHGPHVFAVGPNPQADDGPLAVVAWESTDAGLTFRQLRNPTKVLVDELDEPLAVHCGAAGCVIGSRMTRVG